MEIYIENVKYEGDFKLNHKIIKTYREYIMFKNKELDNGKNIELEVSLFFPVESYLLKDNDIKKITIKFEDDNEILNGGGNFTNRRSFITTGEIFESGC